MNLNQIINILRDSGADAWSVTDEKREGWQFYFIRHRLDQNRAVNTEHIKVTVYRKSADGKMLGSASQEIAPTVSEDEAVGIVHSLMERASYAENPVYELRKPEKEANDAKACSRDSALSKESKYSKECEDNKDDEADKSGMAVTPASVAASFLHVMNSLPETETEDVNSYEIFTDVVESRLVTSTGIDITQRYPSSMLEVVTNARKKSECAGTNGKGVREEVASDGGQAVAPHEIELYRMYLSGACDEEGLRRDITKTLQYGKDRLHTSPTPALGRIPVLFSTADTVPIYDYFVSKINAQQIYQKTSDWKIGEPAVRDVQGDRVTITARKYLAGSSRNFICDAEGALIRDEVLIEDNIVEKYWGSAMYSSWLGLSDTFQITNYEVSGGTREERELRTGRYLEIVEFSDFQVDGMTGNVFGEIRLGYLHDGDTVTIVSGGSVSGSMRDYARSMFFSKETVQYDNARVPAVTKLMDVTVTGAAEQAG